MTSAYLNKNFLTALGGNISVSLKIFSFVDDIHILNFSIVFHDPVSQVIMI